MFNNLPIFGVCGWSGSGKTSLLVKVLPLLLQRGLRIAVIKHDTHGVTQDVAGKDSKRLFSTGADVILHGPDQSLAHFHPRNWQPIKNIRKSNIHTGVNENCLTYRTTALTPDPSPKGRGESFLDTQLAQLVEQYDLILVEGYKRAEWAKVWLTGSENTPPPPEIDNLSGILPWDSDRTTSLMDILNHFVQETVNLTPVFGCILIGGKSTRMGSPKHLLPCAVDSGHTWLHRTVGLLEKACQKIVLAGDGTVPEDLQYLPRLIDAPEAEGPMAGLLSAMRWAPRTSWLLSSCDLPNLSGDALDWLLAERRPGVWAVLPNVEGTQHVEPLLAYYDFRCRFIIEQFAMEGLCSLQDLASHPKALRVTVPKNLRTAWKDADTPAAAGNHSRSVK